MTPEAQRIAIAEACGYRWLYEYIFHSDVEEENDERKWWRIDAPNGKQHCSYDLSRGLPDYLTDLNAMHEAEKVLDARGDDNHDGCGTSSFDCYRQRIGKCATAAQRAEAFLRTLNKWDDSK